MRASSPSGPRASSVRSGELHTRATTHQRGRPREERRKRRRDALSSTRRIISAASLAERTTWRLSLYDSVTPHSFMLPTTPLNMSVWNGETGRLGQPAGARRGRRMRTTHRARRLSGPRNVPRGAWQRGRTSRTRRCRPGWSGSADAVRAEEEAATSAGCPRSRASTSLDKRCACEASVPARAAGSRRRR